jgi:hypothetical protein
MSRYRVKVCTSRSVSVDGLKAATVERWLAYFALDQRPDRTAVLVFVGRSRSGKMKSERSATEPTTPHCGGRRSPRRARIAGGLGNLSPGYLRHAEIHRFDLFRVKAEARPQPQMSPAHETQPQRLRKPVAGDGDTSSVQGAVCAAPGLLSSYAARLARHQRNTIPRRGRHGRKKRRVTAIWQTGRTDAASRLSTERSVRTQPSPLSANSAAPHPESQPA